MRKYKIQVCLSCSVEKKIFTKGVCQACYSKMHRNTDKGKEYLINYNKTKGLEASRRYRLKNRKEPVVKHEKICDCGKKAIAKGFCRNCYQNNRNLTINSKSKKPFTEKKRAKEKKQRNSGIDTMLFERLSDLLKDGIPLYKAFMYEKITSDFFYRNATPVQKMDIKSFKKVSL
jgi:hypothetical protein